MNPTPEEKCKCGHCKADGDYWKYERSVCLNYCPLCGESRLKEKPSPSPEAKCDMCCDGKTEGEVHFCVPCYEKIQEKLYPIASPESKCLCKNGIRGKHCFDYHPSEARVNWELEAKEIVRYSKVESTNPDYMTLSERDLEINIAKALKESYEKGFKDGKDK